MNKPSRTACSTNITQYKTSDLEYKMWDQVNALADTYKELRREDKLKFLDIILKIDI